MSATESDRARTSAWYAEWRAVLAAPHARWIMPAGADPAALHARLLCADAPILWGSVLCQPQRWAEEMADCRTPAAPPWLRLHCLHEVMQAANLVYFTPTPGDFSTTRFLLDGMVTCLHGGIDPTALPQLARAYGQEREQDLATLMRAYLARLHDTYAAYEPAEVFARAAARVRAGWQPPGPVIWDPGLEPAAAAQHLVETCARAGCSIHTLTPPTSTDTPQATISCQRFVSVLAECRAVAQQIVERLARGVPAQHLCVIVAHPRYTAPLRQAWVEAGLCPALPTPLGLAQAPLSSWVRDAGVWADAPEQQPLTEWVRWMRRAVERSAAAARIATGLHTASRHALAARTAALLHEWQTLWVQWRSALASDHDPTLTAAHFRALVMETLALLPGTHPANRAVSRVTITTLDQPWYHTPRCVFLLGASDADLPRVRAGSFFPRLPTQAADPQVQRLCQAFPPPDSVAARDRDYLNLWRSTATEMIVTYCETTEAGRPAGLSALFAEDNCVVPHTLASKPPNANPGSDAQADPHNNSRTHALTHLRTTIELPSVPERIERESALQRALRAETPPPLLTDDGVRAHIAARYAAHHFSATELEEFAACPFRTFARYFLGLRVAEPETADVRASTFGRLFHAALAHLYTHDRETLLALPDLTTPACAAQLDACLATALSVAADEFRRELAVHHAELCALTVERVRRCMVACVQTDHARWRQLGVNAYLPAHCEWAFGGDEAPLHLRDPIDPAARPLLLRGSIDRVDLRTVDRTLVVIDYKTSQEVEAVTQKIRDGRHLQLPLYLRVAEQRLSGFAARGGILYYVREAHWQHGLMERDLHGEWFGKSKTRSHVPPEEFQTLLDAAVHTAVVAAARIAAGDVPLEPHTCPACDWRGVSRHEGTD